MAIVMIQGPQSGTSSLEAVQAAMVERAQSAGQVLLQYQCGNEQQLLERLARVNEDGAQIILLDPGHCSSAGSELRQTLNHLEVPYIEVHDDRHDRLQPTLPDGSGPRMAVINGYSTQSYTLAMSMALEKLGCAECENDVHVGT